MLPPGECTDRKSATPIVCLLELLLRAAGLEVTGSRPIHSARIKRWGNACTQVSSKHIPGTATRLHSCSTPSLRGRACSTARPTTDEHPFQSGVRPQLHVTLTHLLHQSRDFINVRVPPSAGPVEGVAWPHISTLAKRSPFAPSLTNRCNLLASSAHLLISFSCAPCVL